jgi:arabinogalactan endo-1,4-beta-galactosidase
MKFVRFSRRTSIAFGIFSWLGIAAGCGSSSAGPSNPESDAQSPGDGGAEVDGTAKAPDAGTDAAEESAGDAGTAYTNDASTLRNGGFEQGLSGWTSSGDTSAVYVESLNPHAGLRDLAFRGSRPYAVTTEQTMGQVPPGPYTLRAWLKSSKDIGNAYLFWRSATDAGRTVPIPPGLSSALRLTISNIDVTACPCTAGLHVEGPTNSWVAVDDVELLAGAPILDPAYWLGGDISYRRELANASVTFADDSGAARDVLDILRDKGANFVRIRIYNHPGSSDHFPSSQLEPGFQDLADATVNAQDAAGRGMHLLLSFHYSDSWTNPGTQYKPYEWENLGLADLATAVHDYTASAMQAFAAQGTAPDIVTLGNETNVGMLWPDGRIGSNGENFAQFALLFNAGAKAVREVFPSTKVAVHLANPEQRPEQWLGWAADHGLDYDIVGLTLYPFWSNMQIVAMKSVVETVVQATGKSVVALETGFPWALVRQNGYPTLIASNALNPEGPETFGVSPAGQALYLRSFFQNMHEARGFAGALYWDPIWIDTPQLSSNVGDTALFDWQARSLPALDAFGEKFW